MNDLEHIDISGNNFSVLSIACLCSCSSIQNKTAHSIRISPEEILFLQSMFENVSRGGLAIETEDGEELPVEIVSLFEDEIFGF